MRSIKSLSTSGLDGRAGPAVKSSSSTAGSREGECARLTAGTVSARLFTTGDADIKTNVSFIPKVSIFYSYKAGLSRKRIV